jgi:hypothetical protein
VKLKKSPKWSPYGIALSMALTGRCFEEVYKKPIGVVMRCGPKLTKENKVEEYFKCMKNPHRWIVLVIMFPNGRWYTTWFLMVEELFPLELGSPEEWLRSP